MQGPRTQLTVPYCHSSYKGSSFDSHSTNSQRAVDYPYIFSVLKPLFSVSRERLNPYMAPLLRFNNQTINISPKSRSSIILVIRIRLIFGLTATLHICFKVPLRRPLAAFSASSPSSLPVMRPPGGPREESTAVFQYICKESRDLHVWLPVGPPTSLKGKADLSLVGTCKL